MKSPTDAPALVLKTPDDKTPDDAQSKPAPLRLRRRFLQFGLRTLLIVVTLLALGLGVYRSFALPYLRQNEIRLAIEKAGGTCKTRPAPGWLEAIFGEENVCVVTSVDLEIWPGGRDARQLEIIRLVSGWTKTLSAETFVDADDRLLRGLRHLTELETLNVGGQDVSDDLVASWTALTKLKSLDLSDTFVRDPSCWPDFPLEELCLSKAFIDDKAVSALTKYRRLKALSLCRTPITDAAIVTLRELPQLSTLNIFVTGVTPECVKSLRAFPKLDVLRASVFGPDAVKSSFPVEDSLQVITMRNAETEGDGIEFVERPAAECDLTFYFAIAADNSQTDDASKPFRSSMGCLNLGSLAGDGRIDSLSLFDPVIRGSELKFLADVPNLKSLSLRKAIVAEQHWAHLAKCGRLEELHLDDSSITDAGLARLGFLLPRLRQLELENTMISDAGLSALSGCESLVDLDLAGTLVTDEGLQHLSGLRSLKSLTLPANRIRGSGLRYLLSLPALETVRFVTRKYEQFSGWAFPHRGAPAPLTHRELIDFQALGEHLARQAGKDASTAIAESAVARDGETRRGIARLDYETKELCDLLSTFELTPAAEAALPDGGAAYRKLREWKLEQTMFGTGPTCGFGGIGGFVSFPIE